MIVQKCPKCNSVLEESMLACSPPIYRVYCGNCGYRHDKHDKREYVVYDENGPILRK